MIQFNYQGNPWPSFEQQEKAKSDFIEMLGPLKDEFDANNGTVTFYFNLEEKDLPSCTFNLQGELYKFIWKLNTHLKSLDQQE